MHLYPIDGAVHDIAADATAFRHRDARWSQVIVGVDPDPRSAERITKWSRDYWQATQKEQSAGGYVNFPMDEGAPPIQAAYGANFERLRRIKKEYDPDNPFRVNHNVAPA